MGAGCREGLTETDEQNTEVHTGYDRYRDHACLHLLNDVGSLRQDFGNGIFALPD